MAHPLMTTTPAWPTASGHPAMPFGRALFSGRSCLAAFALACTALLTACGGGGGGGGGASGTAGTPGEAAVTPPVATTPPAPADTVLTGTTFPRMVGLNYRTATQSGVTDENGRYRYKAGEQVVFWLAGTELALVPAAAEVTPLPGDDLAASNMLRLFKALDADANLDSGLVFPALPSPIVVQVDFTVEVQVVEALAVVDSLATLPPANDPQVVGALATARSKAASKTVTYGSDFASFGLQTASACPASPALPVSSRVTFAGQPNWTTGAMSGELTLTLGNGSVLSVPFTSDAGTSTQGYRYKLGRNTSAVLLSAAYGPSNGRVIELRVYTPGLTAPCDTVVMELRDRSLPNLLPVALPGKVEVDLNYNYRYTGENGPSDVDGRVVLVEWSASDGRTATGRVFQVSHGPFSEVTVTLTVTDDEGGKSTRTWTLGDATKGLERLLDLLSSSYYVTREGTFSTYYKVDLTRTKVVEVECNDATKSCDETVYNLADVNAKAFLDGLSRQRGGLVYTDPQGTSTGFVPASTLPEGYTVRTGSTGGTRTSGKTGSGNGLPLRSADETTTTPPPSPGTADCGRSGDTPILAAMPPACYKGRQYTFGWANDLTSACRGAVVNDDLSFYNADNSTVSRCFCKADYPVNTVVQPFVCWVFFDSKK